MALPVAPPPRSEDVAINGWSAITVRVAWTLLALGVKVRARVLRDARAHTLFHLDERTKLSDAEDLAELHTRHFVLRARGKNPHHAHDQDHAMPLSPRWRRALERSFNPISEAVFRLHYCDNRGLKVVADKLQTDRLAVEAACAGLQEVVRAAALADGLPLEGWGAERVDRLLSRLAAWSPGPCPPLLDVLDGAHREHLVTCARCDRTLRLVRASILSVEDLLPPTLGARPRETARVLALHFHPDGRAHRKLIREALKVPAFPVGDDLLLLDAARLPEVQSVLVTATQLGRPHRDLLRGGIIEGPGRWSTYGVLGPLADRAEREARFRTWGQVDELGELPATRPPPPSARGAWAAVGVLAVAAVASLQLAIAAPSPEGEGRLQAEFTPGRGGVWSQFDVPEDALVSVVRLGEGTKLEVVLSSVTPADKADLATGDGSYRAFSEGQGVLVAATRAPLPLDDLIADARGAIDPLDSLARAIRSTEPDAAIAVHAP